MKKLSEYDDNIKAAITTSIDQQGKQIIDIYYDESYTRVDDDYGLCTDCKQFKITKMEFGDVIAECETWDVRRTSNRRVEECSSYNKRGQLTLQDMKEVAYIIDVGSRKIGF